MKYNINIQSQGMEIYSEEVLNNLKKYLIKQYPRIKIIKNIIFTNSYEDLILFTYSINNFKMKLIKFAI